MALDCPFLADLDVLHGHLASYFGFELVILVRV